MHRVFLVPGFFGFSAIGGMAYFAHVHRFLGPALRARGLTDVALHDVDPPPTASLQRRAGRLAEVIARSAAPGDAIHLVGHSTGGLDARVVVSPKGEISTTGEVHDAWSELRPGVRSVISIATPHTGAPIATFFSTVQGEHWLRLISVLTLRLVRLGTVATVPLDVVAALGSRLKRSSGERGLLTDVWLDVLRDFDPDRRQQLQDFFGEVWQDRSLLSQLVPDRMGPLDEALIDREGVAYGSVALRARRPGGSPTTDLKSRLHPSYRLYSALHRMAGEGRPPTETAGRLPLVQALGEAPTARDNDAIVPTLSQLHGALVHAERADHLDVLGYFRGPEHAPPHVDWLRSRSNYQRDEFEATWGAIADFIARA